MILKPITGKIYNCSQQVQQDWDQYKDFYFPGKGYFSKSDFETMQITHQHMKGQEVRVKYRKGESCIVDVL